jgi:HAE1 family hydrophobic/amphiphilic exporter-1
VQTEVVPALRAVKGVGAVNVGGTFVRQIQVRPDPARLAATGATLNDVTATIGHGNVSLPGGFVNRPGNESTVGVRADLTGAAQIAQLPLSLRTQSSGMLTVGDIARVVDTHEERALPSTVNDHAAVIVNIAHDSDSDTARTTAAVRSAFQTLQQQHPEMQFEELGADNDFLHQAVNGVLQNLLEGVLLTALVLLLMLHVWRSAVVVMIAIPTSILATFFVMWILGFSIDLLSLMGLSLTVGILVDDSIVVIENITRHREMGTPAEQAALVGRTEIGGAAIAITLVDVVVFAPIAFMSGIVGEFLREYGLVIVTATLFSLLVSFTLTPLLSARWAVLHKPQPARFRPIRMFTDAFERMRRAYHDRALPAALRRPWIVIAGSIVLIVLAVLPVGSLIPFEFQPDTEYGSATATLTYPIGTPLETTDAGARVLAGAIRKQDGVKDVVVTSGGDGDYNATVEIHMFPERRHAQHTVVAAVEGMGGLVPGAALSVNGNGGDNALTYTFTGPTEVLDAGADKVADLLRRLPNTTDVRTTSSLAGSRLEISIDRRRTALLHVSPQAAAETARAAVAGAIATKMRSPNGLVDVVVQLPAADRDNLDRLRSTMVRSDDGMLIPLADIAAFTWVKEPPILRRQDRQRIIRVFANTANGAPIGPIDQRVRAALASPNFLPPGVHVKSEGGADLLSESLAKIQVALLTSFVLIYMLLVILYRNYVTPLVIMVSIPVAIVGALGILLIANLLHMVFPDIRFFAGQTLNIFSMLGIVMLTGLVAKNGILLVDYANTLRTRGRELRDAILESAAIRFRPIMMTTIAMICGMLPLALGFTEGAEFRKSMGTVIIGGLASSLILTLFLVPVVYVLVAGLVERWHVRRTRALLTSGALKQELAPEA